MRDLPRGTVTFLFTDIEGSTRLLHELGAEAYASALQEHRRALRDAFARHGGVEVDTQGDAFFCAFPRASDAVAAAGEGQAALEAGPVRVRMGLHTGEPTVTDEGYVGLDVHRGARIAAAAHGGQVVVSEATARLVEAPLQDLGEHRLKDLTAPQRLFQLGDGEFPRLKTLYGTNLPVPATPFLGRDRELAEVAGLMQRSRLVTLTGAGGTGKTRLALQAAGAAADAYPHGVWWVPLAEVTDPAAVAPAAVRALGGGSSLAETVGDRRLLLLLDNFEHVVDAASEVAALLASCPGVDVVVTSRERLRLHAEQVYPVPPLARDEARDLFVARARSAAPGFDPDGSVDELCERLDDLPLALELAAARTSLLTTEQLLDRLGSRLDLLRGGRDAEERQRTLRATIQWSYELLKDEEQTLLAALSVFRGGWTVETAERVCGADVEQLESLVDKSLVRGWGSGRFGMLETIREFAAEQLEDERRDQLMRRLLDELARAFEGEHLRSESPGQPSMGRAQAERPNVDAAVEWAIGSHEAEAGLRLLSMLELYWATNDPLGGGERVGALLQAAPGELDPLVLARALRLRGGTHEMSHEAALAEPDYERSLELFRAAGDEDQVVHLTLRLANAAKRAGEPERTTALAAEALEAARRRGNGRDEALALNVLAFAAFERGDFEEGVRLGHESASVAGAVGFTWFRGVTLLGVAEHRIAAGDTAGTADLRDGLEALSAVDDRVNLPIALAAAAGIAAARRDVLVAGTLWGAVEAVAEREPKKTTNENLDEYAPFVEPVHGAEFERGRVLGHDLSLEEAVQHALATLD